MGRTVILRRFASAAVAAMLFGACWAMGVAMAQQEPLRLELSSTASPAAAAVTFDGLVPGTSIEHGYLVSTNGTASDSRLAIGIADVVDREGTCNGPELDSGDATCDELGGELSQWLQVSATLTEEPDCSGTATAVLSTTPLSSLSDGDLIALGDEPVASNEERCLVVTFGLPFAADNLTQTDGISFDLTVYAEQVLPGQDVAGEQERPGDGQQVLGATDRRGQLPRAGLALAGLLALGAGAVTTGGWLVRTTRRRGHA